MRIDYEARLAKLDLNCTIEDISCLNAELEARGELDQQARDRSAIKGDCFHGCGVQNGDDCFIIFTLVDHSNSRFVDILLDHHGFPAGTGWSADATRAAFLIIQHGDPLAESEDVNLQRRETHLESIKEAVQGGILEPSAYAVVFDRIQFRREKKQTYATQYSCEDQQPVFTGAPNDTAEIEIARQEIGLKSFKESLKRARQRCAATPSP